MIAMRVFFAVNNMRKKNIIWMILDMTIYFNNKKINSIRAEQQLIVSNCIICIVDIYYYHFCICIWNVS